uniref:Reverse transcriptase domain-containing protein n=1 Tax=Pundamilia nyererei TaxID=303518 RepID=A0A3B4G6B6_9CICH
NWKRPFRPKSTRQGCPLSPGLFVIAIEPLAQKLRNNVNIFGISMGNSQHKLLLYADDMLLLMTQPGKSIPALLECIESFTLLSGYRVNWDKSEAMPMSGHCHTLFKQWEFRWSVNGLRYLGIQITSDYTKMVRANMEPMFERIKMEFGRWSRVRLTIWGKISCIKMMTAPMIFYILSNIPLHIPFLWGSSLHRLSIKKLQASAKQGGFSLPNFQWYYWVMNVKQLRAWLPTCTAPVKPIWSHTETEAISPWRELFDSSHKNTNPIIAKTLWFKLHRAGRWDFIKSPSATLWSNKRILIGGTSVDWVTVA